VRSYLKHVRIHDGQKTLFIPCPYRECPFRYRWAASIDRHVKNAHGGTRERIHQPQDEEVTIQCKNNSCFNRTVSSVKELKTHLYGHTDQHETVQCPFKKCPKSYNKTQSLRSHFHRNHKHATVLDVIDVSSSLDSVETTLNNTCIDNESQITAECSPEPSVDTFHDSDSDSETAPLSEGLVGAVGDFYNCLMNEKKVPYSTTDFIAQKMTALHEQNMKLVEKAVTDLFLKSSTPLEASAVITEIRKSDVLAAIHSKGGDANMSTEYGRVKFIDKNMSVIQPVTVVLNPEDPLKKQRSYQYVPIAETLKLMLEDSSYQNCATSAKDYRDAVHSDIWNSELYKNNAFFLQNPTAIPLILYSDEICITNPLSSATAKKHKMICMYYTLGSVPTWNRTKVDSIQLVMTLRSEDFALFKQVKCYRRVVDELKSLESDGILLDGTKQLVGLLYYASDNLEAHSVGGFSSNFNHGFICRTCDIQHSDLATGRIHDFSDPGQYPPFNYLSEEQYDKLSHEDCNSWVKQQSIFNELQSFHASRQFAPCLGHDLHEGVVAYDLHGLLKIMIQKRGWFSVEKLNQRISQFKFPSKDKPNPIVLINRHKLSGSAAQMWNLIRFLPVILLDLVPNLNDPAYTLLLRLHDVVEICTSPCLTLQEIDHMDILIQEYLNFRNDLVLVDNLILPKPKHHFLSHSAFHYKRFGPLILCWTLRFESKHRFFKDLANKCKNFKNFLYTASIRHQRFQAHILHCGIFKPDFVLPHNAVPLDQLSYSAKTQTTLTRQIFAMSATVSSNPFLANSVTFRGTRYTCDQFVILCSDPENHKVRLGKILKCVVSNPGANIHFVVRLHVGENSGRGFFFVKNPSSLQLVSLSDLSDYVPLSVIGDTQTIVFHHYASTGNNTS
jgi:hypothetical protein